MKNLFEKYMSSAAFLWDGNNDTGTPEKTPAQLARESIKVDVGARSTDEGGEDNDAGDNDGDKNDGDKGEKDSEDDGDADNADKDDNDDDEDKDENKNETEDEKKARIASEKETKRQERIQRRIDKLSAENKNKDAEIERLKAQLKETPVEGLTEEEVERRADEKAKKVLKDQEAQQTEADFDRRNKNIYEAAVKTDEKFDKNIHELVQEVGLIPRQMVYILSDLDNENSGDVMAYLANPDNIDEAEEIWKLPPAKMSIKLVRISDKLKEAKKPARKHSAVPAPVEPVGGGTPRQRNVLPNKPTQNMEDFVRIRNAQVAERRKMKGF